MSRLRGLASTLDESSRRAFAGFSAGLAQDEIARWPLWDEQPPVSWTDVASPDLPLHRPSLVRFRARAVAGVGARSDILCELLASDWMHASALAEGSGYTSRQIRQLLGELTAGTITEAKEGGPARAFRLALPGPLEELLRCGGLYWPDWVAIAQLVQLAVACTALTGSSARIARVKANSIRDRAEPLVQRLGLSPLPVTRGAPEAPAALLAWFASWTDALAQGSSPCLRRRRG